MRKLTSIPRIRIELIKRAQVRSQTIKDEVAEQNIIQLLHR